MNIPTTSLCALVVFVGALSASQPAAATHAHDTSAGGACHAANGAADGKFTYSNNYLTNIGTTDQYVICHLQMDDDDSVPLTHPVYLAVHTVAGATAGTITCVAQEGAFYTGASNTIASSSARSATLDVGLNSNLNWDTNLLTRPAIYYTLTLNCKVPGGFKLGLIEYWEG